MHNSQVYSNSSADMQTKVASTEKHPSRGVFSLVENAVDKKTADNYHKRSKCKDKKITFAKVKDFRKTRSLLQ